MARPLWSGTIQISLVGFAVEIYPATSTTRPISFHEVDRNTLSRYAGKTYLQGQRRPQNWRSRKTSEETEATVAKHSSTLHIAPAARDMGTAREVQEPAAQHTVERGRYCEGLRIREGQIRDRRTRRAEEFAPRGQEDHRDFPICQGERDRSRSL